MDDEKDAVGESVKIQETNETNKCWKSVGHSKNIF